MRVTEYNNLSNRLKTAGGRGGALILQQHHRLVTYKIPATHVHARAPMSPIERTINATDAKMRLSGAAYIQLTVAVMK